MLRSAECRPPCLCASLCHTALKYPKGLPKSHRSYNITAKQCHAVYPKSISSQCVYTTYTEVCECWRMHSEQLAGAHHVCPGVERQTGWGGPEYPLAWKLLKDRMKTKKIKKAPAPRAWFIFKACCLLSYEREAGKWCFKKISANFQLPCCRGFGFNPQLCSKSSSQCLPLYSLSQLSSAFHPSETLGTLFSAVSLPSCHYSGRCAQVF